MKNSPIIVVGMHRSGTTMLVRQLEALGLFMGSKKESNYESTFFLNINRWLMTQTGGAWDNPQSIHYLLQNEKARRNIGAYIARYCPDSASDFVPGLRKIPALPFAIRFGYSLGDGSAPEHVHFAHMAGSLPQCQDHPHLPPRRRRRAELEKARRTGRRSS